MWSVSCDDSAAVEVVRLGSGGSSPPRPSATSASSISSGGESCVNESERVNVDENCVRLNDVDNSVAVEEDSLTILVYADDAEDGVRSTGEIHTRSTKLSLSVFSSGVNLPSVGDGVRTETVGVEGVSRDDDMADEVTACSLSVLVRFKVRRGTPFGFGTGILRSIG